MSTHISRNSYINSEPSQNNLECIELSKEKKYSNGLKGGSY